MATNASATPDPMVTLKVYYDGATRRGKMPLREMVAPVLEQHIRTFLHIPAETDAIIERYSDSAAAYVLLDTANTAVYKQLYRAAKAKSKLKFRVTLKETQEKIVPKPVTVEDEAETTSPGCTTASQSHDTKDDRQSSPLESQDASVPTQPPMQPTTGAETTLPLRNSAMSKVYNLAALKDAAVLANERQDLRREFENRLQGLMERNTGLANHLAHQQQQCRSILDSHLPKPISGSQPAIEPPAATRAVCPATGASFAVCCNSCEQAMPDVHYHCSTCDDGDFDLCQPCVDRGISCYSSDHWLIKRNIANGHIVNSTTETLATKQKVKEEQEPIKKETCVVPPALKLSIKKEALPEPRPFYDPAAQLACLASARTCNACIRELPEKEFLHCDTCEDYDLCQRCFILEKHGHHPKHAFVPAIASTTIPSHVKAKMAPGRNKAHHAICDGCDKYITGVRHKCLQCPDWDYCSDCHKNAEFIHSDHRFVPIYEPLTEVRNFAASLPIHVGICCDGPLCSVGKGYPTYIRGVRYKCAVCHDLDFCANCEATPANEHNRTHPLIKFKTPVRHVSVTTTGEHQDGKAMPAMGDRNKPTAEAEEKPRSEKSSINVVQTVVDVKPIEPEVTSLKVEQSETAPEIKQEEPLEESVSATETTKQENMNAVFVRESVTDGAILPPNHVFEQTWVLRNEGSVSWPAGCSVKFVGGDYMGHVDSAHPAGISELVSASESTVCYAPLAPGQEFPFTVLLRTPARAGKIISYWRLSTQDGLKFGHRLWCDVNVRMVKTETEVPVTMTEIRSAESPKVNTLMFPKLEKESPMSSVHEATTVQPAKVGEPSEEVEDFDDCADEADWDATDDGFMTDEEYDILDASDEEYLEEQQKKLHKK